MRRLIFSPICSSGNAANVLKPANVGITSSQIRIAFGVAWAVPSAGFELRIALGPSHEHADAPHPLRLLRTRRERPCCHAAEKRDELAALHSITSSAAIRRTKRLECGLTEPASLRLDVGRPDHLAPFLGFVGDQLAELDRRSRQRRAAEVS